ncbi:MAG: hypothetical protein ABI967_04450 [bacterium]
MGSILEIEKLALDLTEQERATLAANLLNPLSGVLSDEDEGVAEALRRGAGLDADPGQSISLSELDSKSKAAVADVSKFIHKSPQTSLG